MKHLLRKSHPAGISIYKGFYMNKLHTFAVHAMLAPAIIFGVSSAMAQQPVNQNTKSEVDATKPASTPMQVEQRIVNGRQSNAQAVDSSKNPSMQLREYINSVPPEGVKASSLMNATVKTVRDEDIGKISDLILDKNGQVVAIVVGVGGFLGMGERDAAIGWSHVMKTFNSGKLELRVDVTEENLRFAPEFK